MVIILVATLLVVRLWLLPCGYFSLLPRMAFTPRSKGMGVDLPSRYIALSTFYALGHSGLEEYYWLAGLFSEV